MLRGGHHMANHFVLNLDTTPPEVKIIAPQYTSPDIFTHIIIESNEPLMEYQDIYIIDSVGVRHNLIFSFEETELNGTIQLNSFSQGISTIYCRLKDEAGNLSELVSKTINIMEGNILTISLKECAYGLTLKETTPKVDIRISQRKCDVESFTQKLVSDIKEMKVKLELL